MTDRVPEPGPQMPFESERPVDTTDLPETALIGGEAPVSETGRPVGTICALDAPDLLSVLDQLNALSSLNDLEGLVQNMLALMREQAGAEAAILYLLDADTEELVVAASEGEPSMSTLVGLRMQKHQGLAGAAADGHEPMVYSEFLSDPKWLQALFPMRTDVQTSLLQPVWLESELFGVVQLINFQQQPAQLLRLLGQRLVIEIQRISSSFFKDQTSRRLEFLIEIMGQNQRILNREQLFKRVTEQVSRLVGAERSSLFLVDSATGGIDLNVSYETRQSTAPSQAATPVSILASVAVKRLRRSQATRLADSFHPFGFTTRSAVTVPITSEPDETQTGTTPVTVGGLMALNKGRSDFDDEDMKLLHYLANQVGVLIKMADLYENAKELLIDVIKALIATLDAKDPSTQGHSLRVSEYAVRLAEEIGLSPEQITQVRIASLLHDVGKLGIPDSILSKKGALTPEEYRVMKQHPTVGGAILKEVRALDEILPGIIEHHERLDGSGYPIGLRGEQISMMGRIIAIADVFDAMTSDRPYRPAMDKKSVIQHLLEHAGKKFDADVVGACIRMAESM